MPIQTIGPPYGLPNGITQDTAQWNGLTTSNLVLNNSGGFFPNTGLGTSGINLNLTSNQTNSVQIISTNGESRALGLFGINVSSNAGPFILGDTVDGSISPIGPRLSLAATNNTNLQLFWITNFGQFKLQIQSNGLGTNWVDYPISGTNQITVPTIPATNVFFFRLVPAP